MLRLCFQVYIPSKNSKSFDIPLDPIASNLIYNKKRPNELKICKLSECSATCAGGKEIILLCERIDKEDIEVRFFEQKSGKIVWEIKGDFKKTDVHKETAISFKVPAYEKLDIDEPVKVCCPCNCLLEEKSTHK